MLPYHLTNFKIPKYFQIVPKLNDGYSWNNSPKIKDGAYVRNLLLVLINRKSLGSFVTYLAVLELSIFGKKIKKFIEDKNIITNISRIQASGLIMCRNFFVLILLVLC